MPINIYIYFLKKLVMLLSFHYLSFFLQLLIKYIEIADISYKIIITNFFCKIQKKIYSICIIIKSSNLSIIYQDHENKLKFGLK
jgi:hypothetical protein